MPCVETFCGRAGQGRATGAGPLPVHRYILEACFGRGQGLRPGLAEKTAGVPVDCERGFGSLRRRLGAGVVGETIVLRTHAVIRSRVRIPTKKAREIDLIKRLGKGCSSIIRVSTGVHLLGG